MPEDPIGFEKYCDTQIFTQLAHIRNFSLIADIPYAGSFSNEEFTQRVAISIYENLRDVLGAAKFFYEDELKVSRGGGEVEVEFEDDRYGFRVICREGNVIIQRFGSALSNFHEWYMGLMPSAPGILGNVRSILETELKRSMAFTKASYKFNFLIYDIIPETTTDISSNSVQNWQIMQRLLNGVPGDDGAPTDAPETLRWIGRADYSVNRWTGESGRRRLLQFRVEAPANMEWQTLWFDFSYRGESYTSPETKRRESFNPDLFLTEYNQAYSGFLCECAINGFLRWLMSGYQFKSTPSGLT
jgi:hypothetical protein